MKLARSSLVLAGLMYLGFGFGFLLYPVELARLCEISLEHPTAIMEFRAFFGGLEIGLGAFLLSSLAQNRIVPALKASALILAGILCGRTVGLVVDGVVGNYLYYALAIELPLFLLTIGGLVSVPPETGDRANVGPNA